MKNCPDLLVGKCAKCDFFPQGFGQFLSKYTTGLQNNIGARRGFFRNRAHLMESNKSGFPAEKRHGEAQ